MKFWGERRERCKSLRGISSSSSVLAVHSFSQRNPGSQHALLCPCTQQLCAPNGNKELRAGAEHRTHSQPSTLTCTWQQRWHSVHTAPVESMLLVNVGLEPSMGGCGSQPCCCVQPRWPLLHQTHPGNDASHVIPFPLPGAPASLCARVPRLLPPPLFHSHFIHCFSNIHR